MGTFFICTRGVLRHASHWKTQQAPCTDVLECISLIYRNFNARLDLGEWFTKSSSWASSREFEHACQITFFKILAVKKEKNADF